MLRRPRSAVLLFALSAGAASAASFTYRGQLVEDGKPASGHYDLQFTLYADREGRQPLSGPLEQQDVLVADGAFAVALDLPETHAGRGWLEVAIRPVDEHAYWPLGEPEAVALKAAMCPAAWELGGNAGTLAGTNFLGTNDNQPLELRTANTRSLRIEPSSVLFNGAPITSNAIGGSSANVVAAGVRGGTVAGGGVPAGDSDPNYSSEAPNGVTSHYGFVGGGYDNLAGGSTPTSGQFALVGGGQRNRASGPLSVIAGGFNNQARGQISTIGGGESNSASAPNATVAGGSNNIAEGNFSTVSGGSSNQAEADEATVAGGRQNRAVGIGSTVSGGLGNCAGGNGSWAGGTNAIIRSWQSIPGCAGTTPAQAGDQGTFAWADTQTPAFVSSGPDQFNVRAQGGVGINLAPLDPAVELMIAADADNSDVANIWLKERDSNNGILMSAGNGSSTINNNAEFFIDHYNGTTINRRLELRNTGEVIIRSNISGTNGGVSMAAGSGAWSALSDRKVKTAIVAADPAAVLDRLLAMPISEWSYTAQGEGIRHLGPMAQDFAAAFGLGENATTISSIDADGVALAAIQGLNAKLERENAALRATVGGLSTELATLRRAVAALQAAREH